MTPGGILPRVIFITLMALPGAVLLLDGAWGGGLPSSRPALALAGVETAPLAGVVGRPLPRPVRVRVVDPEGRGVAGVPVSWSVTAGDGRLGDPVSVTDGTGIAAAVWTLGRAAGPNALTAALDGAATPVTVRAAAAPDSAAAVTIDPPADGAVGGDTVAVRVSDRFGNAVAGAVLFWRVIRGRGAVSAESTVTDASGVARAAWIGPRGAADSLGIELGDRPDIGAVVTSDAGAPAAAPAGSGSPVAGDPETTGPSWTRRLSGTPPARSGHAMILDPARGVIVMFGGASASALHTDMWQWGAGGWIEVRPTGAWPVPRAGHAFAADGNGGVIMFGGAAGAQLLQDMWRWDGSVWSEVNPGPAPSGRARHAMTLDAGRGRIVLFGGEETGSDVVFGDTWEWDGRAWRNVAGEDGPPPRSGHALVYDAARRVVVLFGGEGNGVALGDTWEWDGASWLRRALAPSPAPRADHVMVFDAARGRVVLFGGARDGIALGDTWVFDGFAWERQTPSANPAPRSRAGAAFDPRGRVVLFGGRGEAVYADTWEFRSP